MGDMTSTEPITTDDLVVMASHNRKGLEALFMGSETTRVLSHCDLPVLVVH